MADILPILGHVTIKDFIDIFIVSLVIYNILVIIKGTRAVQMSLGLFIILILYWIGQYYQFYSLNWILDHFFDSFFVIYVILFQDQVRGALATFGSAGWSKGQSGESMELAIEEVVEAVGALGREKIGALIVFERKNGLLNYSKTGSLIDSMINSDIIYSIFQNSSPLHDGAIIISKGKIQSAGVFLPLSKNVEIDRHLGTRHRAALGISEVSDAVVIIVSEETGELKICFNGIFYAMNEVAVLRQQLKKLLAQRPILPSVVGVPNRP